MITVSRAINGIGLNGREFLLDDSGDTMLFDSVQDAKEFLLSHGLLPEDIEEYDYMSEDENI